MSETEQDLIEPETTTGDGGAPIAKPRSRRGLIVAVAVLLVVGVLGAAYGINALATKRAAERIKTIERDYKATLTQLERAHDTLKALNADKTSPKSFATLAANLRSGLATATTSLDSIESELSGLKQSSGKAAYSDGVASSRKAVSALDKAISTTTEIVKIVDQENAAFAADDAASLELNAAYATDDPAKTKSHALAAKKMLSQVVSAWKALEELNGAQNSPREGYRINRQLAEILIQETGLVVQMADTEDYDKFTALSKKSDANMKKGDPLASQLDDVDAAWATKAKDAALTPVSESIVKAKVAQAKGEEAFAK